MIMRTWFHKGLAAAGSSGTQPLPWTLNTAGGQEQIRMVTCLQPSHGTVKHGGDVSEPLQQPVTMWYNPHCHRTHRGLHS